ncbi:sulfur dehydrogenase subunit SoxD [Roseibium hamelinense]|uniref:Sulfur dehydrogenase subunit SoxD n=1 Tax=Roseibium hamelinense TaxID=150831 RepID=A0A562SVL8_9HYPH|nr:c-type cytochrome [Roseibium hamelinense]MTI43191.1 c-type cytochrome [Roseibium hamelinense]TWI84760.1 sulfur dehydrogenase subunit SoxD [Roseibium hamelinense]
MSKSLKEIVLPVAGGTALALSAALLIANMDYGQKKIASLESKVEQVSLQAEDAAQRASQEAQTVSELRQKVAEIQVLSEQRAAAGSDMTEPALPKEGAFGLGREAMPEEVAAWDVDVLPDGRGLPEGRGDVFTGDEVFAEKCASCHGDFAEGVDNWPVLAGGFDTLGDKDPVKTVGSYWPYLSTVWDYVHRSMPFGEAQTLTADETYAIVAYILYSNDLVDDDFELSHENFAEFEMYNTDGFVIDDRPELEYSKWRTEPCMENCKPSVEITMRATFLDVTPEGGGESVMNDASAEDTPTFVANAPASNTPSDTASGTESVAVLSADIDPKLIASGQKVFRKCQACHDVGAGAKNKSGPQLNGLIGRPMGSVESFNYSKVFKTAHEEGRVWDEAALAEFLAKPKSFMKGTKMAFSGLRKEQDLDAITAYLKSVGD